MSAIILIFKYLFEYILIYTSSHKNGRCANGLVVTTSVSHEEDPSSTLGKASFWLEITFTTVNKYINQFIVL